ncbi:MAG: glutaredoxin family protein [Oleispira sp.]|nr:glutaredoxin family protein [Oleispira sp.]
MAILLLSTEACHLCELAQQVLQQAFSQPQIQQLMAIQAIDIYQQDIIDQPQWLELYGEKIPVLFDEKTQSILCWPFDMATTVDWLQKVHPQAGSALA